jgi:DNA-binding transcriptional regulator YiaG
MSAGSQEQEYWKTLIEHLQANGHTLASIAEYMGVSERQVQNWKAGQRPIGMLAVKLLFLRHTEELFVAFK